jgi:hypothetical protein
MADRFRCPKCGATGDVRGANSHMRQSHNMPEATKNDVEIIEENSDKPVREVTDEAELLDQVEQDQIVGVADNAIVFRNEVIVTDPEIKKRIADALVDQMSGSGPGI